MKSKDHSASVYSRVIVIYSEGILKCVVNYSASACLLNMALYLDARFNCYLESSALVEYIIYIFILRFNFPI